jgi:hypothetical protein
MRTTPDIDNDLLRRTKEVAAMTDRPLRGIIEDVLRESFARAEHQTHIEVVKLPISEQPPGLCPGVDLDDSAGLLDLMEEGRAAS